METFTYTFYQSENVSPLQERVGTFLVLFLELMRAEGPRKNVRCM